MDINAVKLSDTDQDATLSEKLHLLDQIAAN